MFIRFYGLVTQDDGTEKVETVDAKDFETARDYFETLYGGYAGTFTGELWEAEEEKE